MALESLGNPQAPGEGRSFVKKRDVSFFLISLGVFVRFVFLCAFSFDPVFVLFLSWCLSFSVLSSLSGVFLFVLVVCELHHFV